MLASIGVSEAMGLGAVYRAVQIITSSISQLSVDAYRGSELIDPSPLLVRSPSVNSSRSRFYGDTAASLVTQGNAYWLVDFNSQGYANALTVLDATQVTPKLTSWGTPLSFYYKGETFAPDRIKHMKLGSRPGEFLGFGPIQAAQSELSGALKVANFAGTWFDSSGTPAGGYLKSDQALTGESAKKARDSWTAATGDRKGLPVLGNGFEFKSILLSPKDALWIEAQQFSITGIARLFGIPANLMLAAIEGGADTYANLETEFTSFARFTLLGYVREIEEALSSLLPRGTEARFNMDALLRPDTTTRYAAHAVAIQAGFLTVNEVREIENLPPLPEPEASGSSPALEPAPVEDKAPVDE